MNNRDRMDTMNAIVEKKMDRRVRKTKSQLLHGLTQLMRDKDVKDISVKELSDLVDINRGTFYLHYRDIYDMLEKVEDSLFMEFNNILDKNFIPSPEASPKRILHDIFLFLEANREIACALIGPHGDLSFINRLKRLVEARLRQILKQSSRKYVPEKYEFYCSFLVSGCIGLIETWLNNPVPQPADTVAQFCAELIEQGIHYEVMG